MRLDLAATSGVRPAGRRTLSTPGDAATGSDDLGHAPIISTDGDVSKSWRAARSFASEATAIGKTVALWIFAFLMTRSRWSLCTARLIVTQSAP
jgi:hypothetical protein